MGTTLNLMMGGSYANNIKNLVNVFLVQLATS